MPSNFDDGVFQNKAVGFEDPIQLPANVEIAHQWQEANRSWWENTPMRYDWRESIIGAPGTKAYFDEIDRRFLEAFRRFTPWTEFPFEAFTTYEELKNLDVLEVGVGQGTHAQLFAARAKSFTGIDLTRVACDSTSRRFKLAGLGGEILHMDAEQMSFPDMSFDFIWSWGVIHHSANTLGVLQEMHRVLRPGGYATVMVYYRSFAQYYLVNAIARGLLRGGFWKIGDIHRINQAATDGALARYFSIEEFTKLLSEIFTVEKLWITGQKSDAIPLWSGWLKEFLVEHTPDLITRFITNRLRFGTFLVIRMRRA